jgi:hypothetical protein
MDQDRETPPESKANDALERRGFLQALGALAALPFAGWRLGRFDALGPTGFEPGDRGRPGIREAGRAFDELLASLVRIRAGSLTRPSRSRARRTSPRAIAICCTSSSRR